jgi:hypothetical protein
MKNSAIVQFYAGQGTDNAGRKIKDIWSFNNDELEDIHDYIQWLFPSPKPSRFQAAAPLLTDADIQAFRKDNVLQNNFRHSYLQILSFYGFCEKAGIVDKAPDFEERADNWLTPYNHNFMRITRILESLSLLGLEQDARNFFTALKNVAQEPGAAAIIGNSYHYWQQQIRPVSSAIPGIVPPSP